MTHGTWLDVLLWIRALFTISFVAWGSKQIRNTKDILGQGLIKKSEMDRALGKIIVINECQIKVENEAPFSEMRQIFDIGLIYARNLRNTQITRIDVIETQQHLSLILIDILYYPGRI